ncbi:MAG: hypothetical protein ACOCV8_00475 [Spirochaetota bacterium]
MHIIIMFIILALPIAYLIYKNTKLEEYIRKYDSDVIEAIMTFHTAVDNQHHIKSIMLYYMYKLNKEDAIKYLQEEIKKFDETMKDTKVIDDMPKASNPETQKMYNEMEELFQKAIKKLAYKQKIVYNELIRYFENSEDDIDRDYIEQKLFEANQIT